MSDFYWFSGGINPLEMAEGADLYFEYEAWYFLSAKVILILGFIFWEFN